MFRTLKKTIVGLVSLTVVGLISLCKDPDEYKPILKNIFRLIMPNLDKPVLPPSTNNMSQEALASYMVTLPGGPQAFVSGVVPPNGGYPPFPGGPQAFASGVVPQYGPPPGSPPPACASGMPPYGYPLPHPQPFAGGRSPYYVFYFPPGNPPASVSDIQRWQGGCEIKESMCLEKGSEKAKED